MKVVHLKAVKNGTWALGCRFISELSEDELQRLLTPTHNAPTKETHFDERNHGEGAQGSTSSCAIAASQAELRILTDVRLLVGAQPGSFREYVVKRLNVTKCWPLTAGKILSLRGKSSDQWAWSLRIQVAQCCRQGKGWEIRGQMVRSDEGGGNHHGSSRL